MEQVPCPNLAFDRRTEVYLGTLFRTVESFQGIKIVCVFYEYNFGWQLV